MNYIFKDPNYYPYLKGKYHVSLQTLEYKSLENDLKNISDYLNQVHTKAEN